MSEQEDALGFAPDHAAPIPYMQRIHTYYAALGYKPYRWAQYDDAPFQPLAKPLAESRVAIVTTAAPYQPDKGDQGPGAAYNAAAKFYRVYADSTAGRPDVRISHIGIDRNHTTAEDMNSWFPLEAARRAVAAGRIGRLTERFHGLPTNRSHRVTLQQDCPDLLEQIRADAADVAVLLAA